MDTNIKDELMKDFKESLAKIDFSFYNPKSNEFETTLFIGLMLMVLDEMWEDKGIGVDSSYKSEDEISDEIYGAKKYLQRYMDTNDETFKSMASDELKHASYLIKKAYAKSLGNDERNKLKRYESDVEQVMEQIKKN